MSRFFAELRAILFSIMFIGGTVAAVVQFSQYFHWWMAAYAVLCGIVWITVVKRIWPKRAVRRP